MRYFWVNHKQTFQHEVKGFLWSPVRKAGGQRNPFYDSMLDVRPGDLVFSYADGRVRRVGIALGNATPSPKPDFGAAGANWADAGWHVEVDFLPIEREIRPTEHRDVLEPFFGVKYGPLDERGYGKQAAYLCQIPEDFAQVLLGLIGPSAVEASLAQAIVLHTAETTQEPLLDVGSTSETEREQLMRARRGQGLFRSQVRLVEDRCRITGVSELHHLRASHIKPWRESTNQERLSAWNGLLLAPHVDHLFDRGYISFEDDGLVLVSDALERQVISQWFDELPRHVGQFRPEQQQFLAHHRKSVFLPRAG